MVFRMIKRAAVPAFAVLIALVVAVPAFALTAAEMFKDPEAERRAREIGRELRCMVCQNQSIFDSNAGLARDLRAVVRERIEAGDSNREAIDYIAERYGDYVLLEPPVSTHTYVLWATPIVLLGFGGAMVGLYLARRPARASAAGLNDLERADARKLLSGGSS